MASGTGMYTSFSSMYQVKPPKILSNYIVKRGLASLQDKTILELGSGTGLVGLVAGKLGVQNVWITDQARVFSPLISKTSHAWVLADRCSVSCAKTSR